MTRFAAYAEGGRWRAFRDPLTRRKSVKGQAAGKDTLSYASVADSVARFIRGIPYPAWIVIDSNLDNTGILKNEEPDF
jgi:hypothetical protein